MKLLILYLIFPLNIVINENGYQCTWIDKSGGFYNNKECDNATKLYKNDTFKVKDIRIGFPDFGFRIYFITDIGEFPENNLEENKISLKF